MRNQNYDQAQQKAFLASISDHFDTDVVSLAQIKEFIQIKGMKYPHFLLADKRLKSGRSKYRVRFGATTEDKVSDMPSVAAMVSNVAPVASNVVPIGTAVSHVLQRKVMADTGETFFVDKDSTYVPFGFYKDLKNIVASKIFYPIYITGLSGNGKTAMVEQVCAATGRECIRVNITKETDETDLLGSHDLIDGNTVRRDGPVTIAMKRGAILLLDETDLGSERLLCLQPILEGKAFFDKKTGNVIHPAAGFNVIATANTKGKGNDDGRFIGANILNEAFLERFAITVEQEYPSETTERKILLQNFAKFNINEPTFAHNLVRWANMTRKSFNEGSVDEIISTRRLVHIVKAYSIFNNRIKAIELCLNRFDDETKTSFLDLYTKIDEDAQKPIVDSSDVIPENQDEPVDGLSKVVQQMQLSQQNVLPVAPTAPPATAPKVMAPWATPADMMDVTSKMVSLSQIEINRDDANCCFWVQAYGQKAMVSDLHMITNHRIFLKTVVDCCYNKSIGVAGNNTYA